MKNKTTGLFLILALLAICLVSCTKAPSQKGKTDQKEVKSEQSKTDKKTTDEKKTTEKTEDPDAEMNEYYADMAPKEIYSIYEADTRFHVDYPADFTEDTTKKAEGTVVYRSTDKKQSISVSVKPIGETDYKTYTESVRKEFKDIKIYEYGDESFTAIREDDGKGKSVYMYLAFDGGKIYHVIQTYPKGTEIVQFRPWFE